MPPDHSLFVQLAGMMLIAGAVYGGIRNDQKRMREDIARIERATEKAHDRIDGISSAG